MLIGFLSAEPSRGDRKHKDFPVRELALGLKPSALSVFQRWRRRKINRHFGGAMQIIGYGFIAN